MNFENLTVELHSYYIFHVCKIFKKNQRSIVMSSIKCLNFKFCDIKLCLKNKFISQIINNI